MTSLIADKFFGCLLIAIAIEIDGGGFDEIPNIDGMMSSD